MRSPGPFFLFHFVVLKIAYAKSSTSSIVLINKLIIEYNPAAVNNMSQVCGRLIEILQ